MVWKQFQSRLAEKDEQQTNATRKINSIDEVQKNVNTYTKQVDNYVKSNDSSITTINSTINSNFAFTGEHITGVVLTAGVPVAVPHSLNRAPIGWILTDQPTNSVVFRTAWNTATITLDCSVNCTVAIYIF